MRIKARAESPKDYSPGQRPGYVWRGLMAPKDEATSNPCSRVHLLLFQSAIIVCVVVTQGGALGYNLLGFQPGL